MRRKRPKPEPLLPQGDPKRRVEIATAVILLETAHADERITGGEEQRIRRSLQKFFDLDEAQSRELLELSARMRERSVDLWQFTSTINREVTGREKQRIIEMLWEVVYTDGRLDRYEDYVLHKLCRVLRVSHADMIQAKLRARERMERET